MRQGFAIQGNQVWMQVLEFGDQVCMKGAFNVTLSVKECWTQVDMDWNCAWLWAMKARFTFTHSTLIKTASRWTVRSCRQIEFGGAISSSQAMQKSLKRIYSSQGREQISLPQTTCNMYRGLKASEMHYKISQMAMFHTWLQEREDRYMVGYLEDEEDNRDVDKWSIVKSHVYCLGGGHYLLFSWITCVKWVFKRRVLYPIQVLKNTVYYLIFQFLQFYMCLCLVFIFLFFYFLLCILLVIFWLNWKYNIIFIISFFMWGKPLGPVVPNLGLQVQDNDA
jgi:hypothetical protein